MSEVINSVDVKVTHPDTRAMEEWDVKHQLKCVAGRILTLVDGSIPQGVQNSALKSLIKKEFREQFRRLYEHFNSTGGSVESLDADAELFSDEHALTVR